MALIMSGSDSADSSENEDEYGLTPFMFEPNRTPEQLSEFL